MDLCSGRAYFPSMCTSLTARPDGSACSLNRRSHSITELLFLSPDDLLRKFILEAFPQNTFLHSPTTDHLVIGRDTHRDVQEFEIQEGHARFYTPGRHGFVSAQAIEFVQLG